LLSLLRLSELERGDYQGVPVLGAFMDRTTIAFRLNEVLAATTGGATFMGAT